MIATEIIDGVSKLIQTVIYSNGDKVRRVLDPQTMLPTEILEN